ncbi:MAG: hypothetical protein CME88_12435 [Hirschia sp.]|nr:hypothetical protein [Hirschia sp.]MBF19176.1 hypothetical protein [Hirschia sp.]|tara:strand:- start:302 stop:682 length:381 start_codon:yes stop_codon:yes gene_type:complete
MKKTFVATLAVMMMASPAFAIGNCEKPQVVDIPLDTSQMSLPEFKSIKMRGDSYLEHAKSYLKCLDQIIYTNVPEDPIVSKAGKAHQEYAYEWASVWGDLNLACVNWEASHASQYPGGCQPMNPAG